MEQKDLHLEVNLETDIVNDSDKSKVIEEKTNRIPYYYTIDISNIPSYVNSMNKFMDIHPEFFRTNVSKKIVYVHNNQIFNIYDAPVAFKDLIHNVKGYIITSYNMDTKEYIMKINIKSSIKLADVKCYAKKIDDYIQNQMKNGSSVELYYNKVLSNTIVKYCYYNQSVAKWVDDVTTLKNELFLPEKEYLLSIMDNKINNYKVGSITNSWSNLILHGKYGSGKCLAPDTPVLMYNGNIKKIQNINVGEYVMGDDSTPRTVLNTTTGKSKMYDIIQDDDVYTVNKDHVLSLVYAIKKNIRHIEEEKCYVVKWFNNNTLSIKTKIFSYGNNSRFNKNKYNQKETFSLAKEFLRYIKEDLHVDIPVEEYIFLPKHIKKNLLGYRTSIDFTNKHVLIDPYLLG